MGNQTDILSLGLIASRSKFRPVPFRLDRNRVSHNGILNYWMSVENLLRTNLIETGFSFDLRLGGGGRNPPPSKSVSVEVKKDEMMTSYPVINTS